MLFETLILSAIVLRKRNIYEKCQFTLPILNRENGTNNLNFNLKSQHYESYVLDNCKENNWF